MINVPEHSIKTFIETQLNQHPQQITSPDEMNNFMKNLFANPNLYNHIILEIINHENDIIEKLIGSLSLANHKDIDDIRYLFASLIFLLYFEKKLLNDNEAKIFKLTNEINSFKSNSLSKIDDLKNFLIKKHPLLDKLITENFEILNNNLINDLENAKNWLSPAEEINFEGKNTYELYFAPKQGKPTSFATEIILISLDSAAHELEIKNHFADFIIPSLLILSEKFSDLLDKNDFNDYDKLRKRIDYTKKKYTEF